MKKLVSAVLLIMLVSSVSVFAQKNQAGKKAAQAETADTLRGQKNKVKFGIGLQEYLPLGEKFKGDAHVLGISGIMDLSPYFSIQGIIVPWNIKRGLLDPFKSSFKGDLKMYAVKAVYRFIKGSNYNNDLNFWFLVSANTYTDNSEGTTEGSIGASMGLGLEGEIVPSIWLGLEVGLPVLAGATLQCRF